MRLHLPLCLLSAVLACYASSSFVASATTLDDMWQFESHTDSATYTWTGGAGDNDLSTAGNWTNSSGESAAPAANTFWIFNDVSGSFTNGQSSISDGGGIKVTGEGSSVTISQREYVGSLYVGEGSTLTLSYAQALKAQADSTPTKAIVYVDGVLNLTVPVTNSVGKLTFGNGGGNQYWHIGVNGLINLANTTTVGSNGSNTKTWNIEAIVDGREPTLRNRTGAAGEVLTRTLVTTGADLSSYISSTTIYKQTSDSEYSALTKVDSLGDLTSLDQYYLLVNENSISVNYLGTSYEALTLVWSDGSGAWSNTATGWYIQTNGVTGTADTSYLDGDTVIFNRNGGTVSISGFVTPAAIQVSSNSDYTFAGTGSITGSGSLTKTGTGTLTINNANSFTGAIALNEGTLVMDNANALGSGTLLFNGGTLKYGDGITTDINSQISADSTGAIKVDVGANTVTWNGASNTGLLSLSMVKQGEGTLTVTLPSSKTAYTGAITVEAGKLHYTTTTAANERTYTGAIAIAKDATFQLSCTRATNSIVDGLSGNITGEGTLILGDKTATTTYPGGGAL